jgi:DNA-binding NarL/FixJ family response regulator
LEKIRVLLVDDHKLMREGIRRLLEMDEGIEVVGEAETGEEALAVARKVSPEVVLMDIRMPGMDGIQTMRRLKQARPHVDVIMLTSYAEGYVTEAIEAGASGYLLKSVGHEGLSHAIRTVRAGESVIDRSLSRELLSHLADLANSSKDSALSSVELQVLQLVSRGKNSKQVASELFVSETTVKRVLCRVYNKLGVGNRAEAIAEGYRRHLLL